jgi:hypothetical protein
MARNRDDAARVIEGVETVGYGSKGQGIRILAPVVVKDRDEHGEETGCKRVFFKAVTVWDATGADPVPGKEPVPLAAPAEPITGDSHHHLIVPLMAHAAKLGYSVEMLDLPDDGPAAGATSSIARSWWRGD